MPRAEQLLETLPDRDDPRVCRARGPRCEPGEGKLFARPRIFDDLLSSQPLCFNLFAELQANLELATAVFQSLLPSVIDEVTAITECQRRWAGWYRRTPMKTRVILLVEDDPSDEELTLRALRKSQIMNPVIVVRDGAAALDFLFARGPHAGRNAEYVPEIVLLDLNLPKIGGLDVLRAIRADARTRLLPVVILTSSKEDKDVIDGYGLGANSYIVKPVDFAQFSESVRQLGLYWLVLNEGMPSRDGG